ncbi:MAG: signal peptidase I [Nitrososphaerota archaeon]|nr:signal peptidase I [Candidatus Calditenuis fumarioli]
MSNATRYLKGALPLLVLLLAFLALFVGLGLALDTRTPLVVVASGSMRPVLHEGDILLIEGVRFEEIRASPIDGDVIVYRRPFDGRLIVHRAIAKEPYALITKGDANSAPDPFPVPPDAVVGRWTGLMIPHWTGLGYLTLFLRGELFPPWGPITLAVLIAAEAVHLSVRYLSRGKGKGGERERNEDAEERPSAAG